MPRPVTGRGVDSLLGQHTDCGGEGNAYVNVQARTLLAVLNTHAADFDNAPA